MVYLDGNSLGRLPKQTAERIDQVVGQEWGDELISSWNRHWLSLGRRLGDKIGLIIGSKPGETIVCDSMEANPSISKRGFSRTSFYRTIGFDMDKGIGDS